MASPHRSRENLLHQTPDGNLRAYALRRPRALNHCVQTQFNRPLWARSGYHSTVAGSQRFLVTDAG